MTGRPVMWLIPRLDERRSHGLVTDEARVKLFGSVSADFARRGAGLAGGAAGRAVSSWLSLLRASGSFPAVRDQPRLPRLQSIEARLDIGDAPD
jgi:hypothetical protein